MSGSYDNKILSALMYAVKLLIVIMLKWQNTNGDHFSPVLVYFSIVTYYMIVDSINLTLSFRYVKGKSSGEGTYGSTLSSDILLCPLECFRSVTRSRSVIPRQVRTPFNTCRLVQVSMRS